MFPTWQVSVHQCPSPFFGFGRSLRRFIFALFIVVLSLFASCLLFSFPFPLVDKMMHADMTRSQLMEAVEKHRDTTRAEDYQPPHLRRVLPYLPPQDDTADVVSTLASVTTSEREKEEFDPELHARKIRRVLRTKNRMKRRSLSTMRVMMEGGGA